MGKLLNELKYSFFLIVRPFKGFWELKAEKKGSLKSMAVILLLVAAVSIFSRQSTGYLFSDVDRVSLNIPFEVSKILAIFILWCASNWCLTTLMDGEGRFSEICIATSYALIPYIIIQPLLILLSNYLIISEGNFYKSIMQLMIVWIAFLLFTSVCVTQQYSVVKTFITIIVVIIGMGIISFICLLFFDLIGQVFGFIYSVLSEFKYRIK